VFPALRDRPLHPRGARGEFARHQADVGADRRAGETATSPPISTVSASPGQADRNATEGQPRPIDRVGRNRAEAATSRILFVEADPRARPRRGPAPRRSYGRRGRFSGDGRKKRCLRKPCFMQRTFPWCPAGSTRMPCRRSSLSTNRLPHPQSESARAIVTGPRTKSTPRPSILRRGDRHRGLISTQGRNNRAQIWRGRRGQSVVDAIPGRGVCKPSTAAATHTLHPRRRVLVDRSSEPESRSDPAS